MLLLSCGSFKEEPIVSKCNFYTFLTATKILNVQILTIFFKINDDVMRLKFYS